MRLILVPLDGSPFAEQAIPLALEIARSTGAELHLVLVHVPIATIFVDGVPQYDPSIDITVLEHENEYLRRVAGRLAETPGIRTTYEVLTGPVVPALADYIERAGIDLVVMTTHGRGGISRAWLGSVADGLARRATVPLLLVRPEERVPARIARILVPLDGSPLAEQVLEPALEIGRPTGAGFTLLRVVVPLFIPVTPGVSTVIQEDETDLKRREEQARDYLERVAERLRGQGVEVATRVVVDPQPAGAILKAASELGADLIAIASHGRGGLSRLLLGSVADKVVRGASMPVLLYRPRQSE